MHSQTGYLIAVRTSLVIWVARLQNEMVLSTMEAKYIALSKVMRTLLPLRRLYKLLCQAFSVTTSHQSSISFVWEDNQAAKSLATHNPPKLTPHLKHIAIKYYWF
jgi:hypothetical protein